MASTLDTFTVFSSDSYGLERILRFFQASSLLLTSYPELIALALPQTPKAAQATTVATLFQLQNWFNVTRRLLRLFWFLKPFQSSWNMHVSTESKAIEDWLDILTASTLGIFGLLESATLPDLLGIDNVVIFGPERTKSLNIQAQVFWFVALYASVVSCGIKLFRVFAYRAVPSQDLEFDDDEKEQDATEGEKVKKGGSGGSAKSKAAQKKKQQQLEERKAAAAEARDKVSGLTMKMLADSLDMVLPAVICGWVDFHPGHVGIAMLVSTFISSKLAWKRFALAAQKA